MANGMNKVFLLGNLGADPELRMTPAGESRLRLRIATNERYQDRNGEWKDLTEWHTVFVWGKRAENLAALLSKGDRVMVEGGIRTSSYEKDGAIRYSTEVRAREVFLAGSPRRPHIDVEVDFAEDDAKLGVSGYAAQNEAMQAAV